MRSTKLGVLPALLVAFLLLAAQPAAAEETGGGTTGASTTERHVEPETMVAELEEELMCPVCGTLLGLADAPQAHRQRAMIVRLTEQGYSKQQIKDEMVAEFGQEVLPMPEPSGFSVSAYIVPIAGIPLAAIFLALALARRRRHNSLERERTDRKAEIEHSPSSDPEAERRLDDDLDRYDL